MLGTAQVEGSSAGKELCGSGQRQIEHGSAKYAC